MLLEKLFLLQLSNEESEEKFFLTGKSVHVKS